MEAWCLKIANESSGPVRLVRLLLGAAGPPEWAAQGLWPLHEVVSQLQRDGHTAAAAIAPGVPRAGIGLHIDGLEAAMHHLARSREIDLFQEGMFSSWCVDASVIPTYRHMLMRMPPSEVAELYRAGRRWAALAATSLKKLRTASASAGSTTRSEIPNLRKPDTPGRR